MERMKPLFIYDGDCGFCRKWVRRWQALACDKVECIPLQEAIIRDPTFSREALQRSVHLRTPEGTVTTGALAVFQLFRLTRGRSGLLWCYRHLPGFAQLAERAYRFVAEHRSLFSKATWFFWGRSVEPVSCCRISHLFLRGLGVVYAIAFLSLLFQILGLVGSDGILPADVFLREVRHEWGAKGYWLVPTLAWIAADDTSLLIMCAAGVSAGLLLSLGFLPLLGSFMAWVLYLSLCSVGQIFLAYQWDSLLLEAGFLALFLTPGTLLLSRSRRSPSLPIVFLFRWLLFRLTFGSGLAKLISGDEAWRSFTALTYHYETQPLPNPVSWYLHHLPPMFHQLSCVLVFGVELIVPFLFFFPRRIRLLAGGITILFQGAIFVSGNYTFFNLLVLVLCLFLLDDGIFQLRLLRWMRIPARLPLRWSLPRRAMSLAFACCLTLISFYALVRRFGRHEAWPAIVKQAAHYVGPFQIINTYGLFAVMTTSRSEIIIEGSADGVAWKEYEFRWKPGKLNGSLRFVAPHQPRLDWQMWFSALEDFDDSIWFGNFLYKLLQGSPTVMHLLDDHAFSERPPKYVRALRYDYHFASPRERRSTGAWWKREFEGFYSPVVSLQRTSAR